MLQRNFIINTYINNKINTICHIIFDSKTDTTTPAVVVSVLLTDLFTELFTELFSVWRAVPVLNNERDGSKSMYGCYLTVRPSLFIPYSNKSLL